MFGHSVLYFMCVSLHRKEGTHRDQAKTLGPLKLEVHVVVSHLPKVGAQTQTPVLCKTSQLS